MTRNVPCLCFCLLAVSIAAGQQSSPNTAQPASGPQPTLPVPTVVDSIQVTTTVEPLPLAESDRSVQVLTPRDLPAGAYDSAVDLLRTDSSLNLQARAGEGVLADL